MCLASFGEAATRLEPPGAAEKVTIQPPGRAYLFRGFIGRLTDWGMDELTERINRTGVTASVNSYLMWRGIADQAISDYRRDPEPITIIGHSLGGDAVVKFAERLDAADIPVSLLVTYDPTRFAQVCRRMSSAMSTFISPLTFLAAVATLCRAAASTATMLASISKTAAECSTPIWKSLEISTTN